MSQLPVELSDICVPVLPLCVAEALTCLGADEPDLRVLVEIVGQDPGLAVRLLALRGM